MKMNLLIKLQSIEIRPETIGDGDIDGRDILVASSEMLA